MQCLYLGDLPVMVLNGFNLNKDILLIINPPERTSPNWMFSKLLVAHFFNIGLGNYPKVLIHCIQRMLGKVI